MQHGNHRTKVVRISKCGEDSNTWSNLNPNSPEFRLFGSGGCVTIGKTLDTASLAK